jgi:hypothetical protein
MATGNGDSGNGDSGNAEAKLSREAWRVIADPGPMVDGRSHRLRLGRQSDAGQHGAGRHAEQGAKGQRIAAAALRVQRAVEAGLPELRGRQEFYRFLAGDLNASGLMAAELSGMVSAPSLMSRLTTDFGRQLVRFISPPG